MVKYDGNTMGIGNGPIVVLLLCIVLIQLLAAKPNKSNIIITPLITAVAVIPRYM